MSPNAKAQFITTLLTAGLFVWACGPAAAAVHIEGQVQGGGGPIANSTVTLWAASANAPSQLAQVQTDAKGGFEITAERSSGETRSSTLSRPGANRLSISREATTQPSHS
jgi:hypothetical protein